MIIRKMQEKDIPEVIQIEKECFSDPWTENGFLQSMTQSYAQCIVADEAGVVAGYCILYRIIDEGEVVNIAAAKSFRRRRVASELIQHLFKSDENHQVCRYLLEVRISNHPAIQLYEKMGFEKIGIRRNFYEHPVEDAIIMMKDISDI